MTSVSQLEQRIGRRLTAAETHIRVEAIDTLLNRAKDDLDAAIQAEQARYARAKARRHAARLEPTARMVGILRRLQGAGRAHADAELHSMGHLPRRRAHAAGPPHDRRLLPVVPLDYEATLRARLHSLTAKIERDALGADISTLAAAAIEKAIVKVLGARSIAADLVSPVFISGLSQTFEQHADLVEAWQYTAVNDAGLCEQCAPHDGEIYATLDELFAVLPGFGPNPDCLGGSRCRCRAVPAPPA